MDPLLVYPCFNWYCVRSLKNCNWNWFIEGIQLANCLCLQVNPIVGHLNFLLYDWKREVNHPLIKTPRKKIQPILYMYGCTCICTWPIERNQSIFDIREKGKTLIQLIWFRTWSKTLISFSVLSLESWWEIQLESSLSDCS